MYIIECNYGKTDAPPDGWRVWRGSRQSAIRVFETRNDARRYMKAYCTLGAFRVRPIRFADTGARPRLLIEKLDWQRRGTNTEDLL